MRVSSRMISEFLWLRTSEQVDISIFLCALKACSILTDLEAGRRIHYDAVQAGLHANIYVSNTLINMYAKCRSMEEAGDVFHDMSFHNVVSWNALLLGYVDSGDENRALSLFTCMQRENRCAPDARTYASVAKACTALAGKELPGKVDGESMRLLALERGRAIYSQALKLGGEFDMFLASSFIDMFAKCGSMAESREVFNKMVRRDRVTWNALILGYAENGEEDLALELLACMGREEGCSPNARSFVAGLKACSSLAGRELGRRVDGKVVKPEALRRGVSLHSRVMESGCELELYVASALVEMYSKCGSWERARVVFDKIQSCSSVSWNSLMLGYVENEQEEEALNLFTCMKARGCLPDSRSYVAALKACSGLAGTGTGKSLNVALEKGKAIHKMAAEDGFDKDIFVASTLVDMYSRCRSMKYAKEVFEGMTIRNVVSWTALILGYIENKDETAALELFARMQTEQGYEPTVSTFIAAIKACSGLGVKEAAQEVGGRLVKVEALKVGMELHQQAKNRLLDSDVFLSSALVEMYSKCGSLLDCKAIFDGMSHRDVVSWNALLSAYVENGEEEQALELFRSMDCPSDARSYVACLKACTGLAVKERSRESLEPKSQNKGVTIHAEAKTAGFELDSYVSTCLVDMYAKFGRMAEAREVYDRATARTPPLWTALVLGYLENSDLDSVPELLEILPRDADAQTFVAALKACATLAAREAGTEVDDKLVKARWLEKGRSLHSRAVSCGLDSDTFVANTLVDMYTKCGSLVDARRVFERTQTAVSWNALMLGYIKAGEPDLALELFERIKRDGFVPELRSYTAALKACSVLAAREQGETVDGRMFKLKSLEKAMELESQTIRSGVQWDVYLAGSLAELYAKCRSVRDCYRVLERTPSCNVFTWNSLLLGYVENGEEELGLELFSWMRRESHVDVQTVVRALRACIGLATKEQSQGLKLKSLNRGRDIHEFAVEAGLASSVFVAATLVSMYCKSGSLEDAFELFNTHKLLQTDVVSWNVLILGLAEAGEEQQAFEAFTAMRRTLLCQPDDGTYIAVLKACGSAASVELTREASGEIARTLGGADGNLANALLDAFGKCGSMSEAQHVFDSLATTDVVTWNSLLSGYSHRGAARLVLSLFHEMQARGLKPNGISLVCVLTACSHAGLVENAQECFEAMVPKFGISPRLEHYHCVIDALGRSNRLKAAVGLVKDMVIEPNAVTWFTVLAACHKWKNAEVGQFAFESLLKTDDGDTAAAYTLMSNIWR